MPSRKTKRQPAWRIMGQAMAALARLRKPPEEAAAILYEQLTQGLLANRADSVWIDFPGEPPGHWTNQAVSPTLLDVCPIPPLGHAFWISGDVKFIATSPSQALARLLWAGMEDLALIPDDPQVTISGLKVSGLGLDALCRAIKGDKGRGRRKGAGSLAAMDEPLLVEMRELIQSHAVASIPQAAAKVIKRAAGGGTVESRIKRLGRRYRERFPER